MNVVAFIAKRFIPVSVVQKLGWVETIGCHVKVHGLPLCAGSVLGAVIYQVADEQKTGALVSNAITFFGNQTVLDSMCAGYNICGVDLAQGGVCVLATVIGCIASLVLDCAYNAMSPKYAILAKANEDAEKAISLLMRLTGGAADRGNNPKA